MRYVLSLCLMLVAGPAAAAEILFAWKDAGAVPWPRAAISITGEIKKGDETLFLALADLAATTKITMNGAPYVTVDLNSEGGNVTAAMRIGKIIRDRSMLTFVGSTAECVSACVFILQAGVDRFVADGGKIGLHRPRFPSETFAVLSASDARTKYNEAVEAFHGYWEYVGGNEKAWEMMMATPSNSMTYVTETGMIEFYGLIGMDVAYQELMIARRKVAQGGRLVDFDPFAPKK